MILNISKIMKIPDATMKLSFEENINFIESKAEKIKLVSPIKFKGELISDGKMLYLNGDVNTVLELHCDRCTKPVPTSLSIRIEEKFGSYENDEEEIHIISGNEIDLTPILINAILLNIPMKVVCSEECKGICPQCGKNLNEDTCDCKEEVVDSRFAVLRTLFDSSK
ncbi:YceD family protein [Defluviitalea phaphyphila]|uniref:YceD family protein n=1 Tax=Defluviitalea phaphyphila TaxID=1473580 RepID=UPI000731CC15|nr:DUF177 domain-containing protein [Defluviitalea phaphyphila]